MKHHIDKWGKARYGQDVWPTQVRDGLPALFLGITGIDEEFRNRDEYANSMLYETRLAQIVDALGPVMNDFGGKGTSFTNVYPLRYPGTWDANTEAQQEEDPVKWQRAEEAFLHSNMVRTYIASPEQKWCAAMCDEDGGMSLISSGWREVTTAKKKQNQLEANVKDVYNRLLQLARGWVVNPDANVDREQRITCAKKVLDWLASDKQLIYDRVKALEDALCLEDGDQWALSDFADMPTRTGVGRPDAMDRRFPRQLQEFLHEWATVAAPKSWEEYTAAHPECAPWLDGDDFNALTRYLRDYLCSKGVFDEVNRQLLWVVGLKLRDEAAKRRARRKYVRIMLNDFAMNPGTTSKPLEELADDNEDEEQFGLMCAVVRRWRGRLPQALASGAGAEIRIPPGNVELIELLQPYEEKK